MKNWIRTAFSMLAVTAIALIFAGAPVSADGNTQISGVGVFDTSGECTEISSFFTITMDGDFVGCWYTTTLEVVHETPSGGYRERGTETFVGCLSDGTTCGTFDTTYQFEAKFAPDGSEIHGHCEHPLVSGTGDFAGIEGRISFKDDVATGEYNYRGHFKLQ